MTEREALFPDGYWIEDLGDFVVLHHPDGLESSHRNRAAAFWAAKLEAEGA